MHTSGVVTTLAMAATAVSSGSLARAANAQGVQPYTPADVQFMQGMIHHHAQALVMAAMAPTHGASERVRLLCQKITLSQRDEIGMMRQWLQYRGQGVPDSGNHMLMTMTMPGMLSADQLRQLDQAHDTTFDRLFLAGMIQHHRGALKMVADLVAQPPSGQESEIFRFITDIDADQRAEIGAMQQMLYDLQGSAPP